MQLFLTLWIAGLSLLVQVKNCNTNLCIQARTVANQAITLAQSNINQTPVTPPNNSTVQSTPVQPIPDNSTSPVFGSTDSSTPTCPSVPNIDITSTFNGVVSPVQNDTIILPLQKTQVWGYVDMNLEDTCVPLNQLMFSYSSDLYSGAISIPHLWDNPSGTGMSFAVSSISTTTQYATITASEPDGQTVTKNITIITQ